MQLIRFENPDDYEVNVSEFLSTQEAENNLLLGIISGILEGRYESPYMALVEDRDRVYGAALMTPPHPLVLSHAVEPSALRLVAEDVRTLYPSLSGVNAEAATSRAFASHWSALTGQRYHPRMNMRIYKLESVTHPEPVPGTMRRATPDDFDTVFPWAVDFATFTPDSHMLDIEDRARANIERLLSDEPETSQLYVWEVDGQVVSMTAHTGPTPNGMRIGYVYTPPELRGHGYASALVAALSQKLLDEGRRFCFLFTDLSNPTSNNIYQRIGYHPVSDVDTLYFE